MDLSEFKPPVRLSMSDEDIQAALGSASANEEGMLAAMAMLEEQANLREYDNQQLALWVAKMQSDSRPQAAIALQNLERAKVGQEPLPFEEPEEALEAVVQEHPTVIPEEALAPVDEPVDMPEVDAFEAILTEAAVEATTSVELPGEVEEVVEADEIFTPAPIASNFEVSADEDASVVEEQQLKQKVEGKKDRSWLLKLGSWSLFGAVVPAISLAIISAFSFAGFATTTLGFAIGTLAAYGVHSAGFATASRGERSYSILSRATFGVWGAALPGVVALVARVAIFSSILLLAVNYSSTAISSLPSADTPLVLGIPFGLVVTAAVILLVGLVVAFAAKALQWVYALAGAVVLAVALVLAAVTSRFIDFSALNTDISLYGVFATASIAFLVQGVATFALESRGFEARATMPSGVLQRIFYPVFYVLIPVALFAHVEAIFDTNALSLLFDSASVMQIIFGDLASSVSAVGPWLLVFLLVVILIGLFDAAVESFGAFGANLRAWWQPLLLTVVTAAAFLLMPEQANWYFVATVAAYALCANMGAVAAEALLRRGSFHDASLLRGYGFYKRFNILGLVTYVLALALVLVVTGAVDLQGFGLDAEQLMNAVAPYLAFASFGITFVLTFATSIPRIREQQAEAKDIEERRKALTSVYAG